MRGLHQLEPHKLLALRAVSLVPHPALEALVDPRNCRCVSLESYIHNTLTIHL